MSKRVAILQSNYIPWKGYFDLINSVDEFILYDDMQYTRRDWRNRNKIKTSRGPIWLSIPVKVKGKYDQKIKDTEVDEPGWNERHWQSIVHAYGKAPYFATYRAQFEELYRGATAPLLSDVNFRFIAAICEILGIRTKLTWSMDYQLVDGKTERLVDLCRQAGATDYLSGPAARDYVDETLFERAGIGLRWMDYGGYPEYAQPHPPFDHFVSVIDLLFSTGPDATAFMKTFAERATVGGPSA